MAPLSRCPSSRKLCMGSHLRKAYVSCCQSWHDHQRMTNIMRQTICRIKQHTLCPPLRLQ